MLVRFWGTRGSLPVAARAETVARKIARALVAAQGQSFADEAEALAYLAAETAFSATHTYGGATSCVEIEGGDGSFVICDMGSGLRELGIDAMARCADGRPRVFHIFLSHLHWDHIMGLPFFGPAFDPQARIVIHAGHADAEEALRRQQDEISFPVPFDRLRADISIRTLAPDETYAIAGMKVRAIPQYHSHTPMAGASTMAADRSASAPTPSIASTTWRTRGGSRPSSAMPICASATPCIRWRTA